MFSGGPGSGKTTVISELSSRGFKTKPDVAREYISAQLKLNIPIEEIRKDELEFGAVVLNLRQAMEIHTPKNDLVFFDGGIIDGVGFDNYYGFGINDKLQHACRAHNYRVAFLLELNPESYVQDESRIESYESALKIRYELLKAYALFHINVIEIPFLKIEDRVDEILKHIQF